MTRKAPLSLTVGALGLVALCVLGAASGISQGADSKHADNVPACTDAIADAGGVCKGEPPTASLPPCVTEDGSPASEVTLDVEGKTTVKVVPTDCYWDAKVRGNHKGLSFVIVNDQVYYVGIDVTLDEHGRPYLITK